MIFLIIVVANISLITTILTGFGVTSTGGSSSDKLMEVNLQYISNDNCMGGPSGDYQFNPGQITNEMMW